MKRIQNSN